jgi:hypothetical protein
VGGAEEAQGEGGVPGQAGRPAARVCVPGISLSVSLGLCPCIWHCPCLQVFRFLSLFLSPLFLPLVACSICVCVCVCVCVGPSLSHLLRLSNRPSLSLSSPFAPWACLSVSVWASSSAVSAESAPTIASSPGPLPLPLPASVSTSCSRSLYVLSPACCHALPQFRKMGFRYSDIFMGQIFVRHFVQFSQTSDRIADGWVFQWLT